MTEPVAPGAGRYLADLEIDFASEDENGLLWAWLDRARDKSIVVPGVVLVLRDGEDVALGQVADLERLAQGTVVRVRLLPGAVENYQAAVDRAVRRSA